jgi:hypothetical protein
MSSTRQTEDASQLLRAEYAEFPELRLTLIQIMRLLELDHETTAGIVEGLVKAHFLEETPDGCYVRAVPDRKSLKHGG